MSADRHPSSADGRPHDMRARVLGLVGPSVRWWPALAAGASAAMLASAHAFERIGGYPPCELCLRQREVYWAALALIALGAYRWVGKPAGATAQALDAALAGVFVLGAALATYHAGIEWDWWLGPESCTAVGGVPSFPVSGGRLRAALCDEAPWRMLGVSMAGWNALVSIGLAGASLYASMPGAPPRAEAVS